MFGLILGAIFIPVVLIVFFRVGQTIQKMLDYGNSLPTETAVTPPVSLIKPVYGADAYMEGNFQSWVSQNYNGRVQHIYSFQREDDPTLPLAKQTSGESRLFWEAFLMDGLFLYVFFKSIFSKKITWADIDYQVLADGRMQKV